MPRVKKNHDPVPDYQPKIRHIVQVHDIVPQSTMYEPDQYEEGDGQNGVRRFSVTVPEDTVLVNVGQRHDGTWFYVLAKVVLP